MKIDVNFSENKQTISANLSERDTKLPTDMGEPTVIHDGMNGATFYPAVSEDGVLSWTNNRELENPPPVNIKGKDGKDGAKGDKGDKGDRGAKGDKGDTGEQGIQGVKGDKGDRGAQGIRGEKGDRGAQGIQGIQGIQGAKGDKGDKGDRGESGVNGKTPYIRNDYWYIDGTNTGVKAKGTDGSNGKDGANGAPGKDGKDGVDGVTPTIEVSTDGYWVINGVKTSTKAQGEDGKDGVDGAPGADGRDGLDGRDGWDGAPGADGYTPVKGVDYYTDSDKAEMVSTIVTTIENGGLIAELLVKIEDLEGRVKALEPRKQLFDINAAYESAGFVKYDADDGTPGVFVDTYSGIGFPLEQVCPGLIDGKEYTFSCYAHMPNGEGYDQPCVQNEWRNNYAAWDWEKQVYYVCFTFTANGGEITFCGTYTEEWFEYEESWYPEMVNVPILYYRIMVNEGTEPLPWEPYKG